MAYGCGPDIWTTEQVRDLVVSALASALACGGGLRGAALSLAHLGVRWEDVQALAGTPIVVEGQVISAATARLMAQQVEMDGSSATKLKPFKVNDFLWTKSQHEQ